MSSAISLLASAKPSPFTTRVSTFTISPLLSGSRFVTLLPHVVVSWSSSWGRVVRSRLRCDLCVQRPADVFHVKAQAAFIDFSSLGAGG